MRKAPPGWGRRRKGRLVDVAELLHHTCVGLDLGVDERFEIVQTDQLRAVLKGGLRFKRFVAVGLNRLLDHAVQVFRLVHVVTALHGKRAPAAKRDIVAHLNRCGHVGQFGQASFGEKD